MHTHTQDIAIFTNDASRCSYYQRESANVKSRFACVLPEGYINQYINQRRIARIPNERKECEVCGEGGEGRGGEGEGKRDRKIVRGKRGGTWWQYERVWTLGSCKVTCDILFIYLCLSFSTRKHSMMMALLMELMVCGRSSPQTLVSLPQSACRPSGAGTIIMGTHEVDTPSTTTGPFLIFHMNTAS